MPDQLALFSEEVLAPFTELESTRESALKCEACQLHSGRKNVVFGKGLAERPPIMFIGEAPGSNEDETGDPFVGRAGKMLDQLLEAIGMVRSEVYVSNCVKCRPPGNRVPDPRELAACATFIVREMNVVRPHVICLLGMTAARNILGVRAKALGTLRGKPYFWRTVPVRVTYHPAYLLRAPDKKGEVIDDFKLLKTILSRQGGSK